MIEMPQLLEALFLWRMPDMSLYSSRKGRLQRSRNVVNIFCCGILGIGCSVAVHMYSVAGAVPRK